MKFRKLGQVMLTTAVSLGLILGVTACNSRTIDFVYVTSAKQTNGQIYVYEADSDSGVLHQIQNSPYPSGGRNPVAAVVSSTYKTLYVVNHDDNTVVAFTIGPDGKLYSKQTVNPQGSYPVAAAYWCNTSTSSPVCALYVVSTYQPVTSGNPPYSDSNPGPGALTVYPVVDPQADPAKDSKAGTLGTPLTTTSGSYYPLGKTPSAINVLANSKDLFVANQADGTIYTYSIDQSTGALTKTGSVSAGTSPSGITSEPRSNYVYVTDYAQNEIFGYRVLNDTLSPFLSTPTTTGNQPNAIVAEPRGKYVYVVDYNDSKVVGYSISTSSGVLSSSATNGSQTTGSDPKGIVVEPGLSRYIYVVNYLSDTVSGFQLDPNTGGLVNVQGSIISTGHQPTAIVAVPHGTHAIINVNE